MLWASLQVLSDEHGRRRLWVKINANQFVSLLAIKKLRTCCSEWKYGFQTSLICHNRTADEENLIICLLVSDSPCVTDTICSRAGLFKEARCLTLSVEYDLDIGPPLITFLRQSSSDVCVCVCVPEHLKENTQTSHFKWRSLCTVKNLYIHQHAVVRWSIRHSEKLDRAEKESYGNMSSQITSRDRSMRLPPEPCWMVWWIVKAEAILQIGSVALDEVQCEMNNWIRMYRPVQGFLACHFTLSTPSSSLDLCSSCWTQRPLIKPKGQELNPIYPHAPLVAQKSNEHVGGEPGEPRLRKGSKGFSLKNIACRERDNGGY